MHSHAPVYRLAYAQVINYDLFDRFGINGEVRLQYGTLRVLILPISQQTGTLISI